MSFVVDINNDCERRLNDCSGALGVCAKIATLTCDCSEAEQHDEGVGAQTNNEDQTNEYIDNDDDDDVVVVVNTDDVADAVVDFADDIDDNANNNQPSDVLSLLGHTRRATLVDVDAPIDVVGDDNDEIAQASEGDVVPQSASMQAVEDIFGTHALNNIGVCMMCRDSLFDRVIV
jgi:hypothetical protein